MADSANREPIPESLRQALATALVTLRRATLDPESQAYGERRLFLFELKPWLHTSEVRLIAQECGVGDRARLDAAVEAFVADEVRSGERLVAGELPEAFQLPPGERPLLVDGLPVFSVSLSDRFLREAVFRSPSAADATTTPPSRASEEEASDKALLESLGLDESVFATDVLVLIERVPRLGAVLVHRPLNTTTTLAIAVIAQVSAILSAVMAAAAHDGQEGVLKSEAFDSIFQQDTEGARKTAISRTSKALKRVQAGSLSKSALEASFKLSASSFRCDDYAHFRSLPGDRGDTR